MITDKSKIRKGMNITVVKSLWSGGDRSFQGDVIKVVTVQRPFMVVDVWSKYAIDNKPRRTNIKLDEYEFMQLNRRFVRAALQQN